MPIDRAWIWLAVILFALFFVFDYIKDKTYKKELEENEADEGDK
ncbi:hypothetical protein [Natranaerofaba carboxydovora]|nr:hypothetical protein [Natranaerofaba carboxydovora]